MSDLAAAAEAMGVPEALVERSARARAASGGNTYEEVLAAWAGGGSITEAAPPPSTAPEVEPEAAEAPETPAAAAAPPETPAATEAPVTAAAASAAPPSPPPAPATVTLEEARAHPVVVTVPTAGITERTSLALPGWLASLLLVVPAFGLLYLALGAGAECGPGTALAIDRVTGLVENCDGSPFEGRGAGGGGADFVALGEALYLGQEIASVNCATCHGAGGGGSAAFPALTGVLTTFGACADHIEWVSLGSAGFQGTYGDTNKPLQQGMPAFGGSLSAEQLAAVSAFERVRFGGGNPEEVLADCGLAEEMAGENGEEGEETPASTVP